MERANLLFGCYRKGDANDAETYTASIAAVLSDWPESVVIEVTDPRLGLARKCQWLPTVAEVYAACEAADAPRRRAEEQAAREAELLARRADQGPPRETRETLAELKARHGGENFGVNSVDSGDLHRVRSGEFLQHANQVLLERECEATGFEFGEWKPSPALLKTMGGKA